MKKTKNRFANSFSGSFEPLAGFWIKSENAIIVGRLDDIVHGENEFLIMTLIDACESIKTSGGEVITAPIGARVGLSLNVGLVSLLSYLKHNQHPDIQIVCGGQKALPNGKSIWEFEIQSSLPLPQSAPESASAPF